MNILVLEDDEGRIDWFKWWLQHHNAIFARTVEEAKRVSLGMDFDTYLLDHDLAEEHYKDQTASKGTGQEFAKYLAKNVAVGPSVIVHSMNIPGSKEMAQILKKAGHKVSKAPFFVLRTSQRVPYPA